jgi:GNAT superfamily N-acetyltransferase
MGEIPDLNLFMMCHQLEASALTTLSPEYTIRSSRPDELGIWKAFPFDTPEEAVENEQFMTDFFLTAYAGREDQFFERTKFVCDARDVPVATGMIWPSYRELTTVHWFKVVLSHEGRGIGRALLSELMQQVPLDDYPVYLHTQPGSYRAIKLYSDFGFRVIVNENTGTRPNDYVEALRHLEAVMPPREFRRLDTVVAPRRFEEVLARHSTIEF